MEKQRLKFLAPFLNKRKAREDGNVIDLMAGVLVMVLIFAVIIVMVSYGSLVDKKLTINSVVKDYLYLAEQQGGLTVGDVENLKAEIKGYGANADSVTINGATNWVDKDNGNQVPYGDKIDLEVTVSFTNPVYATTGLNNDGSNASWFKVGGLDEFITYTKKLS